MSADALHARNLAAQDEIEVECCGQERERREWEMDRRGEEVEPAVRFAQPEQPDRHQRHGTGQSDGDACDFETARASILSPGGHPRSRDEIAGQDADHGCAALWLGEGDDRTSSCHRQHGDEEPVSDAPVRAPALARDEGASAGDQGNSACSDVERYQRMHMLALAVRMRHAYYLHKTPKNMFRGD